MFGRCRHSELVREPCVPCEARGVGGLITTEAMILKSLLPSAGAVPTPSYVRLLIRCLWNKNSGRK